MRTILITGAAGFIGYHLAERCLAEGDRVIGLDNFSDYYSVELKQARAARLAGHSNFSMLPADLSDAVALNGVFKEARFDTVVNLAAQAGVRYSIENPSSYVQSNLVGFANLLECCRKAEVPHLVFASSSSVYGANTRMPFSVHDNVDHPLSLYAATKKSNELLAHSYANLYGLPCSGLRFFTVYGPWGRPDMAYYKFTRAIRAGQPIQVFNHGRMKRDFTYIDDVVEGVFRLVGNAPRPNPEWSGQAPDPATSFAPYRVFNIGNHSPVSLERFIGLIEAAVGKSAVKEFLPMQDGDVPATYADVSELFEVTGFSPETPLEIGIERFVRWHTDFYPDG